MLPDRVSNPGLLTYESGALLIALCGPSKVTLKLETNDIDICVKQKHIQVTYT